MTVAARPPTRRTPTAVLIASFALSIAAVGCMDKEYLPVPWGHDLVDLPQTSPAGVLADLQLSYDDQDIDKYRKLFAPDFVFVFNPSDILDPDHPTPDHWGLAEELNSALNMFRDESVNRIEFRSYVLGVPEQADSLTYGPRAWKVRVSEANLRVHTRIAANDTLTYEVEGATEVFFFREEPNQPARDGKPTWFIFRWEDQPIGTAKTQRLTWGAVKARFR